jgi:hypothetical protein
MASQKLSALVNLAGGQVPTDLMYIVDVSAGVAGSKRSTLNDAFSIITKNITDGALRFQGFAAPALSGAGTGAIYFDSTANAFRISENAGAYRAIGDVFGPGASTDEALARFDGATGKLLQDSAVTLSNVGAFTFPDDVRQTFNPGVNNAGLNVGALAGDPATPANGDVWYNSTTNLLKARINGASVSLGQTTTPGGLNTQVQYNNAGAFGGVSGFTSDGTNVTAGSGNLRATSPRITTNILDANGLSIIELSPAAVAVNQFTIANAATGNAPTLSATGTDAAINITISPKSTGFLQSTGPLQLSGTGTINFTTPVGNSVPTKIDVPLFNPGAFSQILAMGLDNTAAASARVICAFDQRAAGHQPSIALQAPDENNIGGFSWDGSNTNFYVISTAGVVGVQGRFIQESGGVVLATLDTSANAYFGNGITNAAPASYVLNATGGLGSNIAGGNLDLAGGKGTGTGTPGMVAVRYPLIGASGAVLQSLSTDRYPVSVSLFTSTDDSTISNTAAETSIFTGLTASAGSTRVIEAGITRPGTIYRIRILGNVTSTGTPTIQIRGYIGATVIANTTAVALANNTNGRFWLTFDIRIETVGATGATIGFVRFDYSSATAGLATITTLVDAQAQNIDYTANQTLDVTVQFGAASPSNLFQSIEVSIERLR